MKRGTLFIVHSSITKHACIKTGEREEWVQRVGWHRKEDIRLRLKDTTGTNGNHATNVQNSNNDFGANVNNRKDGGTTTIENIRQRRPNTLLRGAVDQVDAASERVDDANGTPQRLMMQISKPFQMDSNKAYRIRTTSSVVAIVCGVVLFCGFIFMRSYRSAPSRRHRRIILSKEPCDLYLSC